MWSAAAKRSDDAALDRCDVCGTTTLVGLSDFAKQMHIGK